MGLLEDLKAVLEAQLGASEVELKDVSGGCGSSFDLLRIVSPQFAGQRALQRHRLINGALKEAALFEQVHSLSIKQALDPEEALAQPAPAAEKCCGNC